MRQVIDPVAIQIQFIATVPKISNSADGPMIPGNIGRTSLNRMQVVHKYIFREAVSIGVRTKAQANVILCYLIAGNVILVALIKRKPNSVFGDFVLLEPAAVR